MGKKHRRNTAYYLINTKNVLGYNQGTVGWLVAGLASEHIKFIIVIIGCKDNGKLSPNKFVTQLNYLNAIVRNLGWWIQHKFHTFHTAGVGKFMCAI